jgi:hypothetical protein
MKPQGEEVSRPCRSAAYKAAPRQAKTAKQLENKYRQYGGGLDAGRLSDLAQTSISGLAVILEA